MGKGISRRQFLDTSGRTIAGLTAGLSLASAATSARGQAKPVSKNEKIVLGLIGCGGMGRYKVGVNMMSIPGVEVAALCDVDERQPDQQYGPAGPTGLRPWIEEKYGRKPDFYVNYHELLERKDIDAVVVATCDHWHALAAIHACMAEKDVYVEKPCCHNIHEGRLMVKAARKYNRIVQVGMQQRSSEMFQKAVAFVKSGALGDMAYTRTWKVQNFAPGGIGTGEDGQPPAEFHYDRWLGPAPLRPYNSNRAHYNWRWFYDYGCTLVGDWNVHLQDIVHWALDCYSPLSVVATGGKYVLQDNRDTPDTMDVTYEFQRPNGKKFVQTFSFTFCCGTPIQGHDYGIQFFGENGSLFVNRSGYESFPDSRGARDAEGKRIRVNRMDKVEGKEADESVPHQAHAENFIKAVRSRKKEDLNVDIETGYMTAAACHLGNISYKLGGKKIWWNPKDEIIVDKDGKPDKEANVLLTRDYRKPYTLPEI